MKILQVNLFAIVLFVVATPLCGMEQEKIIEFEKTIDTIEQKPLIEQEYFKDVPEKYKDIFAVNLNGYKRESKKKKYKKVFYLNAIAGQDKYKINDAPLSQCFRESGIFFCSTTLLASCIASLPNITSHCSLFAQCTPG